MLPAGGTIHASEGGCHSHFGITDMHNLSVVVRCNVLCGFVKSVQILRRRSIRL